MDADNRYFFDAAVLVDDFFNLPGGDVFSAGFGTFSRRR
jgi:hypothetical protein